MIRNAQRDFEARAGLPDGQFFADPFVSSGNPESTTTITKITAG
jgi:CDP-4-dehydro-6-deoxyglucose reductase/3-phenylpropionate/trans-cinnamate dioxygenase ferredoxin reductase subunit